jgi:NAD(P)-dependent dehydrogenase (short-subunit alcohol dehydrogenase family)
MAGRLKGKVALVIGAGSIGPGWGNGKATAVAYGREGATVVCVDRNPDAATETAALVREEGAQALALQADVSQEDDVRRVVAATLDHYGAINVLHNNVGLALLGGPVDISMQDWERSLDLNIGYMFLTVRHVLPVMEQQRAGAIVNVSSIASIRWLGTAYIGYAAANSSHCAAVRAQRYQGQCDLAWHDGHAHRARGARGRRVKRRGTARAAPRGQSYWRHGHSLGHSVGVGLPGL